MRRKAKKEAARRLSLAPFRVEIDRVGRGLSVLVGGATAILEFSEERSCVSAGGYRIEITGHSLSIAVYECGSVEIVGRVEDVGFILEN